MLASLVATTTMLSVTPKDVLALAGTTHGAETTLSATLAAIEFITSIELHTFVFAAGGTLLALGVYPASLWSWQLLALAFITSVSRLALLPTLAAMHRVAVQVHTRFVIAAGGTLLALGMYPASLWYWQLLALAFITSVSRLALLPTLAAMHRVAVQVHTRFVIAAGGTLLALGMYPASLWFWQLLALAFDTSESRLALLPTLATMHRVAVQVHTFLAAAGFPKLVTPAMRVLPAVITVVRRLLLLLHQEPTLNPCTLINTDRYCTFIIIITFSIEFLGTSGLIRSTTHVLINHPINILIHST